MIFAMEELAKAAYLQLKALNPNICIANLDSYFHKHEVKHSGILALLSVLRATEESSSPKLDQPSEIVNEGIALMVIFFILSVAYLLYIVSQKWTDGGEKRREGFSHSGRAGKYDFSAVETSLTA